MRTATNAEGVTLYELPDGRWVDMPPDQMSAARASQVPDMLNAQADQKWQAIANQPKIDIVNDALDGGMFPRPMQAAVVKADATVQNMVDKLPEMLGGISDEQAQRDGAQREIDMEWLTKAQPGGAMAGDMLASAPLMAVPGRLLPQVLANAAYGGATAPYGSEIENAIGMGAMAGVGQVGGSALESLVKKPVLSSAEIAAQMFPDRPLVQRVAQGMQKIADAQIEKAKANMTPAARAVVDVGGKVAPGVATNSRLLRSFEAWAKSNPFTADYSQVKTDFNNSLLSEKAIAAVGGTPDMLQNGKFTPETFGNLADNFNSAFEQIDTNVGEILMPIEWRDKVMKLPGMKVELHKELGSRFLGLENGQIATGEYSQIRTALNNQAKNFLNSSSNKQPQLAQDVFKLIDQLDGQAERYIGEDGLASFQKTREQYRNFLNLQKGHVVNANGEVSAPNLKNALSKDWGTTFNQDIADRIQPETAELFKTVRAFANPEVRDIVGSSGTSERLSAQSALSSAGEFTKQLVMGKTLPYLYEGLFSPATSSPLGWAGANAGRYEYLKNEQEEQ